MSAIKCKKFVWSGMGARPSLPPSAQKIVAAKTWAKANLITNSLPAYQYYTRVMLPNRMQRIIKLWAWNAIPSHKGGDVIFDKQDFKHNRYYAKNRSSLWATCLEPWLNQEICWRIDEGHTIKAFVIGLLAIDKEIDYTLGMISRGKNTYPTQGEKLMYEVVVELAKMTNSVYNYYAPNIK